MAGKRANNEGSVYRIPSGRWCAQVSLEGKRLSKSFDTQKEGLDWIRKILGQIDQGLTFDNTKISLGDYMADWLDSTQSAKRPTTWNHYNQVTKKYIIPIIGKIKVKDLRPEHIQGMYNQLLKKEVGTYTILKIHTVIHCAMQYAVKIGIIGRNPVSFTHPPREPAIEMKILTESQVNQLLTWLLDHRWEALFYLAVTTGMRQMELLGLKWTDLDWDRQSIKVERQLVRSRIHGVQFSMPKTRFGKRSIALGMKTIEVLRRHYEKQQIERLRAGDKWQRSELIFTNSIGGPIHYRNLLREFKRLLNGARLPPIRFHDLRHTAASIMLNNGIPPIVVSRRLGHAKASITLDVYGHLIPSMQREAAEKIDELIMPIAVK